jgi:predicted nucleic acid-binding protein
MKAYWDSSALIDSLSSLDVRRRLHAERGWTRNHSLSEMFSALTGGNLAIRITADRAAEMIEKLVADLDFVELTESEILSGLKTARAKGVRGGRIHDFLHAVAAEKSGAPELLTADQNDFHGLSNSLTIVQV